MESIPELKRLLAMWEPSVSRSTTLIAKLNKEGVSPDHWAYDLPSAFNEALDIAYQQRKKNKKPYMVWTQGARLRFLRGDTVISKDKKKALQVTNSGPMGWDTAENSMYKGFVVYEQYTIDDGAYTVESQHTTDQVGFLGLIITGELAIN